MVKGTGQIYLQLEHRIPTANKEHNKKKPQGRQAGVSKRKENKKH